MVYITHLLLQWTAEGVQVPAVPLATSSYSAPLAKTGEDWSADTGDWSAASSAPPAAAAATTPAPAAPVAEQWGGGSENWS